MYITHSPWGQRIASHSPIQFLCSFEYTFPSFSCSQMCLVVFDHWNVRTGNISIFRLAHDNLLHDFPFSLLHPYFAGCENSKNIQVSSTHTRKGAKFSEWSTAHTFDHFYGQELRVTEILVCLL